MDTRQQESKQTEKDQTQILDEIGIASIKARMKQLSDEISVFNENLNQIERQLELIPQRFELYKKIVEVTLRDDNFSKIEPVFKYEKLEEYKQLRRQEIMFQVSDEEQKHMHNMKALESQKKAVLAQKQSSEDELERCKKQLGE